MKTHEVPGTFDTSATLERGWLTICVDTDLGQQMMLSLDREDMACFLTTAALVTSTYQILRLDP